jgi:hypothetical protein
MRWTLSFAALGLGLAGVAVSPAFALAPETLRAHIPFAFTVGNQTFPAGDYRISPLSDLDPQVVEIRSADGRHARFVMTQGAPPAARGTQPQLVFDRYGARDFLHAILVPEDTGAMLKSSRSELEAARSVSSPKAAQNSASSMRQ